MQKITVSIQQQSRGALSTPFFGQPLTESSFIKNLKLVLFINFPVNISSNLTMAVEVEMDTDRFLAQGSEEYVKIKVPDVKHEIYRHTGYRKETFRYPMPSYYRMEYKRDIDIDRYEKKSAKLLTVAGFSVRWHLENNTRDRVDIQPEKQHSQVGRNEEFARMVNILQNTDHEVFEDIRTFRRDWVDLKKEKSTSLCDGYKRVYNKVIERFLDEQERKLNITKMTDPLYENNVTDISLTTAARMYITLLYCPTVNHVSWIQFYQDFFNKFSSRFILQTLVNLSKVKTGGRNIPGSLLSKLDHHINLQYEKIDLAMDKKSTLIRKLKDGQIKKYAQELEHCLNETKCNELNRIINTIGASK